MILEYEEALYERKKRDDAITKRVQEHYQFLQSKGYDVVCTMLQGSQNYGLDIYTEEYQSDVDTKSIVLPSLEDFINNKSPVSTVEIMDNDEHAEVKDIRVMFDMFKKMNLSYIELLYSKVKIVNPKYEDLIAEMFENRELIASYNRNQFLRCIAGMAYEKRKALCHPYPGIIEKIEKYGYDGKQLSHCARLSDFIDLYVMGKPLEDCYEAIRPSYLINLKQEKDADGNPLSVDDAIALCDFYCNHVKEVKDENLDPEDKIDERGLRILNKIRYEILKRKLKEELDNGK